MEHSDISINQKRELNVKFYFENIKSDYFLQKSI